MSQRRNEVDAQVKRLLASCKSEEEKVHRYLRIAQQYLFIEEHCEGERYLLRHIKAKPDSHEAHKLVGELYLKLRRFQDAYDSLTTSYQLNESKDVLASICLAAPHASIPLTVKQEWLRKAEVANVSQISMLSLKEVVLRESDASVQEMEDVLKEQAALYPLDPEAQIKLLVFFTEANRFEDCLKVILREESKQELRNSPHWYRECQNALQKLRASKAMPYDQTLALLHLHVSQRYTLGLITDPFFIADQDKGSVGLEPFFKQLEIFDQLLDEALTNKQWYREGLWSFAMDHFTGQLLFLFALGMLRRADESNREDTYKARGQALMFCALEYRPKKFGSESWFLKAKDDVKKLLCQVYLDGCYRTTACYHCLANTSTDPGLADSVKIAVSGNSAIRFVTERLFPGKAIAAVYSQAVISRACVKLPDRATIAVYEMNSCIAFSGSLEHLVWLLLSGAEMPTERIFPSLPLVPNIIEGAQTPSQSDIDAFLAAVLAAVKVFGNKLDIIRPTVPREILHRAFTTTRQQNFWNAMYRTFVKKVTSGRDVIQSNKLINDGLKVVRAQDVSKSMPIYYLVQIARSLRDKGHKKNAYFSVAVSYFKVVLSQLDEHPWPQPLHGGGRASPSALFEFPKMMAVSENAAEYRDEARLEIGKFLFYSGELENARAMLDDVYTPMGYLYYAKTAKKLSQKFIVEGDVETGERLLEKAKMQLHKAILSARNDPESCNKIKDELEALEKTVSETAATLGTPLNVTSISFSRDTPSNQEGDMAKFETLLKEQTEKILVESAQKSARIEAELGEMKTMQTKLVETLAQVLAEQTFIVSQTKSTVLANSEIVIKLTQLSQQLSRVEELVNISQNEYVDYQDSSSNRSQQYQSGGLFIPPGAGLPQFNLTSIQHPSAQAQAQAQASYNYAAASRTTTQPMSQAMALAMTPAMPPPIPPAMALAMRPAMTPAMTPAVTPAMMPAMMPAMTQPATQQPTTPAPKTELDATNTNILLDAAGVIYEKQSNGSYSAVAGSHKICVLEMPNKNFLKTLWYYSNSRIYIQHDLHRMTYQTFEDEDEEVNVQWTYGDKSYYIAFADTSWQPGEILHRIFQYCKVPRTKSEPAEANSPVESNNFLAAALSRTPAQSPLLDTSPKLGRAEELPKLPYSSPLMPTPMPAVVPGVVPGVASAPAGAGAGAAVASSSSSSPSSGILPTPVLAAAPHTTAAAAAAASSFSFNFPKAVSGSDAADTSSSSTSTTASITGFGKLNPPTAVSSLGGFTFNTTPVAPPAAPPAATSVTADVKSGEKPKQAAPNPFSGFSFNLTKTEDAQKPLLPSWATASSTGTGTSASTAAATATPSFSFGPTTNAPAFTLPSAAATAAGAGVGVAAGAGAGAGVAAAATTTTSPAGAEEKARDAEHAENPDEYECTAQFEPVIPLPSIVVSKTGEENEEEKFCEKARLYRFDDSVSQWKERGVGQLKILRNPDTGRYRILMRRDLVLKLCANHQLIAGLTLKPRAKPTEYLWATPDFADGVQKNEKFVVRFKTEELASKFRALFEEGVKAAESASPPRAQSKASPKAQPQSEQAAADSNEKAAPALPSLKDMFKPPAGSWTCSGCYVNNGADVATCVACGTANPAGAQAQSSAGAGVAPAATSLFKFGVPAPAAGSGAAAGSEGTTAGAAGAAAASSSASSSASAKLGDLFKPDPNSWKCPTCMISNAQSTDKCAACETARPGATLTSSPFKFGVPNAPTFGTVAGAGAGAGPASGAAPASASAAGSADKSSKAAISTTFTFGTTLASSAPNTRPASGFVFGQTVAAPSVLASSPPKIAFGGEKDSDEQKPSGTSELSADFTFGSPQQHRFSFLARQSDDDDDQVVESQDRDFAPAVASLPPEIEIVTGEEGQTCLYKRRAKLFRFIDREWKERGLGEFKILLDPASGKVRLTMRRDQVHKVCLNHYLSKETKFSRRDDKSLEWHALDFSEGKVEPTLFAMRVGNREAASELLDAIHNAQNRDMSTPVKAAAGDSVANESAASVTPSKTPTLPKPQTLFTTPESAVLSSASSDSVEVVKVEEACDADVRRARQLMLPDHFFLYESRENRCKGCRGCEADESPDESPDEVAAQPDNKQNEVSVKPKVTPQKQPSSQPTQGVATSPAAATATAPADVSASPADAATTTAAATAAAVELPHSEAKSPPKPPPVFGAPSMFGTVAVEQKRNESLKPLDAAATTTHSGFVFGSGSALSFSSLAASNAASGFAKPSGENPWAGQQGSSFFSAFSKTAAPSVAASSKNSEAEEGDEVTPSDDIHFEPVIPMPELVTVQTGEEQDEVLFSQRAKLYVFHAATSEWKERAIGDAKILRCADGRARIVVRRETVHKVACNHYITEGMELKPLSTSNNCWTWSAVDFAEGDPTPQLFALRMKGEARLNEFKKVFIEEVEKARKAKEEQRPAAGKADEPVVIDDAEDFEFVGNPDETRAEENAAEEQDCKEEQEEEEECDDEDEEEECGDEEQDKEPYFDEDNILFAAVVDISEEVPIGESRWKKLGTGILRVVYDDEIFGLVIYLSDSETDTVMAETVIAVQTSLRELGLEAIWMAQDTLQKPSVRRRFCVKFSSEKDLKDFVIVFEEGKETALQCGIVENSDQPPWSSPTAPFS